MAANIYEQTTQAAQAVRTFEIVKQEEIAAPIGIVFETILEQMGPLNSTPEKPMPMKLEAWPGGRWFRDLGNNTGHSGATVQAIKPPRCWKFAGRCLCPSPCITNLQYRLTKRRELTVITVCHRAYGLVLANRTRLKADGVTCRPGCARRNRGGPAEAAKAWSITGGEYVSGMF